ncbi:hypothetical protein ACOSQB_02155 [Tenacibaculum sp. MEBiC07804]|uniref:hypothetical protein n=1 Tax=Tenacibaculum sp. MEBiC07804 TaxID=3412025 RepID=UPI003BA594B0
MKTDVLIKKIFSKNEIDDLQKVFDFFNNEICNSNNQKLNECYNNYCLEIRSQIEKNVVFNTGLNFEKQKKLYEKLRNSTFKEIWSFQQSLPIRERKDTLKYLGLNYNGKYRKFLNESGNENKAIKNYAQAFNVNADLGPSMIAELGMNYKTFNTQDLKTKLIIAIHYLTLNDQNWRNEKY